VFDWPQAISISRWHDSCTLIDALPGQRGQNKTRLKEDAAMIRRARSTRRSGVVKEVLSPSPDQISKLTAEIRKGWSPKQLARRAGGSKRVEVMIVSACDVERWPGDDQTR
jgi:hypothetical protein